MNLPWELLLDVYTSPIFRFSFALPVSFVYGEYSVRVKRKIFGEVRVGQAEMWDKWEGWEEWEGCP